MTSKGFRSRCGITKGYRIFIHPGDGNPGEYKTLYPIGMGGTGEVWKASDLEEKEFVIVKFFAPAKKHSLNSFFAEPETDRKRITRLLKAFKAESSAVKEAPSGTTPKFLVASLNENPPYFMVEYTRGFTLLKALRTNRLSEHQKHARFNKICRTVHKFHEKMLHLDLKPENIFLKFRGGKILLLDLGSSAKVETLGELQKSKSTRVHTKYYASPEVVECSQKLSPSSDVFSLGCILFRITTGEILTSMDQVNKAPQNLRLVVEKAVEKDPLKRFQTAEDLRQAFRTAIGE